ncbi:MAG TPA: diacylglycerol kinase family protein [Propionibacteriaceae bacterium]|nr:diacylglycerol kinase family protein [Propionibacteriaceae bacterium]
MVARLGSRTSRLLILALAVAFAVWTYLVLRWTPLQNWDRDLLPAALDPLSPLAQIASAFALLTWPGLQYATLVGIALWALRHRLRQLGAALLLIVPLAWGGTGLLKLAIHRERPEQALNVLTSVGYAYPSSHMAAIAASVIAVGATLAVTRQSVRAKIGWQLAAVMIVSLVALDRWVMGAHFVSDLVGGLLYGALVATVALVVTGVSVPVPHELVQEYVRSKSPVVPEGEPLKRCAVIYNPAKVTDWLTFRRHVEYELQIRGWEKALWLETTVDDPGRAMTAQAVDEGVDLVLGAGGDGTIRVICSELAGTGIPFGLIAAGTGNLLARNIGVPLDEGAALDVAFDGFDLPIDLVQVRVDDGPPDHFAVMAGIGIDAMIMQSTNADLKKAVGSAAYFVSAAQNANHPALHATIRVDDRPPLRRRAHVIVVGNVGYLQANIPLMPDAKPNDGLLDVMIASPRGMSDWIRLTTKVLTRQRRTDSQLDRLTGRRVQITVEERDHYQLDGDRVGECSTMTAEVRPGALTLRVPRAAKRQLLPTAAEAAEAGGDSAPPELIGARRPQGVRSRRNQADALA